MLYVTGVGARSAVYVRGTLQGTERKLTPCRMRLAKPHRLENKGGTVTTGCILISLARCYARSSDCKHSYLFTTGVGTLSTTVVARPSTAEPEGQYCVSTQISHQHAALECCMLHSRGARDFRLSVRRCSVNWCAKNGRASITSQGLCFCWIARHQGQQNSHKACCLHDTAF